jgi:hypothetical protein
VTPLTGLRGDSTLLSNDTSVRDYCAFERMQNKRKIAELIRNRFTERYIVPIEAAGSKKHGFCTMAISCLMIESLESFRCGWEHSKNRSKDAFQGFFGRNAEFTEIPADSFYSHVRCGILHQAETTGGWKINRSGPLFDRPLLKLNATAFHRALKAALDRYCDELATSDWQSDLWIHCRRKLHAVVKNCAASPNETTRSVG